MLWPCLAGGAGGSGSTGGRGGTGSGVNLVADPGFEDGAPRQLIGASRPWLGEEPDDHVSIVRDGTAHTGQQYACFPRGAGQLMQMVTVTPYTGYRVRFWISGTPGVEQHLTQGLAGFYVSSPGGPDPDNDGDAGFDGAPYLKAVPFNTGSGAWHQMSLTFNSGPFSQVSVNFVAGTFTPSILRFDDISVIEEAGGPLNPRLSGVGGDGQVTLSWTAYPGTDSYVIWRADETLDEWPHPITTVRSTSFTDTDVTNGHQYTYQVTVQDGWEVWIFSYEKLAFTPGP